MYFTAGTLDYVTLFSTFVVGKNKFETDCVCTIPKQHLRRKADGGWQKQKHILLLYYTFIINVIINKEINDY